MPLIAYGLMLFGDLASGVTPPGLFVIGPLVMGVPLALGFLRVAQLRFHATSPEHAPVQT
jgi:hypothetical protein